VHTTTACRVGATIMLIASLWGGGCMAQDTSNLLLNHDLENGVLAPTGWVFNSTATNVVSWQVSPGTDSHIALLEGSGTDWAGLSSGAIRPITDDTFTVGAWMRVLPDHPCTDRDRLYIRFFAGRFMGQEGPSLADLDATWQLVSGVVKVPEGAQRADVSVQIWSDAKVQVASLCLLGGSRLQDVPSVLGPPPQAADTWKTVDEAQGLPTDRNDNGLPDTLEEFLSIEADEGAVSARRSRAKTTSFQTGRGYSDDNDLKVDIVIVAGNEEQKIQSWSALGYETHVMVGFRAGKGYLDAIHNGVKGSQEVQTDSSGRLLTCGPGSYYMAPSPNRRELFRRFFVDAVGRGAKAACPEEPEFFSRAGYSEAFKREWNRLYNEPWQDQATSVQARFKSDRLKVALEHQLLQACYEGARSVDPTIPRFLLTHSPLNYTAWGIVFGHHDMISTGLVDSMVAQVWTGTARSAVVYQGMRRERTFENAYLEYASCLGLTRDTGIDLWFLMDPLEDNPDRSMADYQGNYVRTLVASLMFPQVSKFETMPWPSRIFGRVPDEFATEICSIINVLSDMHNQQEIELDCGPPGIGTFLSDSAMWQRGAPHAADMNCFYGITLPLLMRGIPVEVPHLDRAADPGYLDRYKVLFVSYDLLKPMKPQINEALARWAREGGCLVVLGGEDPYNDVPLWWQQAGFATPQNHLLSLCGFDVSRRSLSKGVAPEAQWQTVATTDYAGRDLENQTTVRIDLTPLLTQGAALIKCEDSLKNDGWGPLITGIKTRGLRDGEPVSFEITPGSEQEARFVAVDSDSSVNAEGARFCDASSYVIYRFEFDAGTKATLDMQVGNQYLISAAAGAPKTAREYRAVTAGTPLGVKQIELPASETVVTYERSGAADLYAAGDEALLSQMQVGQGTVLLFGASPAWFAQSAAASDQLRALTRYALQQAGGTYHEQGHIKLRRGRYTIAKTFDQALDIEGAYLNVLDAKLPLVQSVHLEPDELAVLRDVAPDMQGEQPKLLFAASCVEWQSEEDTRTRLIVSGARGTTGVCRLFTAGKSIASLRATDTKGNAPLVDIQTHGDTALLSYPNEPMGLALDIQWAG